jgi:ABC-type uncharacterized transport system permease subunit
MFNIVLQHIYANVKLFFAYTTSSLAGVLSSTLNIVILYYFWANIYGADKDTIQYVIYARIIYFFVSSNNVWNIAGDIKNGNVAIKLTKPLGFLGYNMISFFSTRLVFYVMQYTRYSTVGLSRSLDKTETNRL